MPITDYNKKKKLEVSSANDSGTTQDKAQPILVKGEAVFDVSSANFVDSFDVSGQDFDPQGVTFSDSGDKMFVVGADNDNVYDYSLSTSFDVSTASFVDSFDVSGQDFDPQGVTFSDSGDKMFVVGADNDNVYEYFLSSSFDVSTASFVDSFDVSGQTSDPKGLAFSDSGDKMFVVGSSNDSVFEYSLGTSFDVSTASLTDSFDVSAQESSPAGLAFSSSGGKMFVVGSSNDSVFEYSLGTSFDVSTAGFVDSFDVSGQDFDPQGVTFSGSGGKMFVVGAGNDNVYEYSIGGLESKTGSGDIVIDFTNIADAQDIAVYDENGNLLDYEIESLDTAAETGVIWAYDSWVRDDSVQAQVAYGNNSASTDRQNVTGTWGNSGQNTNLVQHLNGNSVDSTSNNNDGTIDGATSISSGEFDGAYSFDGADDKIDLPSIGLGDPHEKFTLITWVRPDTLDQIGTFVGRFDGSDDIFLIQQNTNQGGIRGFIGEFGGGGSSISFDTGLSPTVNEWNLLVMSWEPSSDSLIISLNAGTQNNRSNSISNFQTTDGPSIGARNDNNEYFEGDVDETRIYRGKEYHSINGWVQAEYDASPKAGQVFFSQQAAETISTVTDQTVTIPETTTSSTNPDPQVNATVDVSIPTSTATAVNPAPTVSPGAAPLNLTATTANTLNPDFTVQPGSTTVQTPVSTSTVSNLDPQVNAFNEVTVPESNVATFNPAPTLTVGQTIITPDTTVTSSNPDLTVQPGATSLKISTTQVLATNPEFGLNRQIVVGVATNLSSENPEPNLQPGAVSVQVPETSILTDNPALQLQPGATRLQIERPTNLETVNPDFNTVSGAAELQVSETQLTASLQEPSIGLTLEFVSPTNALITNDERFFDMPDHTFTEGDLGDTLQAVLKTDASPDGVDLTGATEIRLVVKDRDGIKVFDKEMSLADRVNGKVEYKWSQGDFIEEPGVYRAKIKVFDSTGEPESFPNDGFRTIEIEEEIG